MDELLELEFFLVRNEDGKWFRRKGYGGYGENWVTELSKARVYNKIGPARACVGFYANNYPKFKPPQIVKITTAKYEVIDETERIEKLKAKKIKAKANQELKNKKWALEEARKNFELAERRLKEQLKK